jgi:hypothetical protein
MKNEKILICGAEGGSLSFFKNNSGFFHTTDERTMLEFTDEFPADSLVNTSKLFDSLEKVITDAIEKYDIFNLHPLKISPKYKLTIQEVYFKNKKDDFISEEWLIKLFQIESFHKKFVNLNIETITNASKSVLKNLKEDNYIASYSYFLDFTSNVKLDIEKFIVCSNMVYGWMPTILNLDLSQKTQIEKVLEKLNRKLKLSLKDFQILKKSINNSVVGMSKFLHFCDPYKYPIFDSKVYSFITGKKYASGIDKPIAYIAYINKMRDVINHKDFSRLHSSVCDQLGKKLSPMRSLELIMFYYISDN